MMTPDNGFPLIHKTLNSDNQEDITRLFTSVFSSSEGEEEGKLIGKLVSALSLNIDNKDIICFATYEEDSIIGVIFFTRLYFEQDINVYMLAPVAVSTPHQGKGIGQALIRHGLNELTNRSVEIAITYGDPAFYSKVGFRPLSETTIQAPLTLSIPEGWLGYSLTGEPIQSINSRPRCVEEFNNPVYW